MSWPTTRLSRGSRFRRRARRRQATESRHYRASARSARLEFRPEVPALRPQGPPCRNRPRRRSPHKCKASRPEGGASLRACRGQARRPAPHRVYEILRDRAILLLGFAGGLRRSEIVGPVTSPEDSFVGSGRPEFFDDGVLLTLRGKTGWREVEIGRGSSERTCPVARVEARLKFARIARGPMFRAPVGREVGSEQVATAASRAWSSASRSRQACAAISRNASHKRNSSGHSLRAEFASSAESDERYVQKHVVQASAEMTRRYQLRRDRFRVNLTKAACP